MGLGQLSLMLHEVSLGPRPWVELARGAGKGSEGTRVVGSGQKLEKEGLGLWVGSGPPVQNVDTRHQGATGVSPPKWEWSLLPASPIIS